MRFAFTFTFIPIPIESAHRMEIHILDYVCVTNSEDVHFFDMGLR